MGNESSDYSHIRKRGQKEKTITVMKRYRILEKIMAEGTEDQTSLFYPQYMDSNTLDQNITVTSAGHWIFKSAAEARFFLL